MLSSSALAGILFPAVPAGMPFPAGPVDPVETLSLPYHDGTLSPTDIAGILFPAVPAGIPFPAGPVGPVDPVGTLSLPDPVGTPSPYRLPLTLLALWALMGRYPHPTLPECCFQPFLLGCRS